MMKKIYYLFFPLLLLSLFACSDDKEVNFNFLTTMDGEIRMTLEILPDGIGGGGTEVYPETGMGNVGKNRKIKLTLSNKSENYTPTSHPFSDETFDQLYKKMGGLNTPTELSIDWGDGTKNSETTHTYEKEGTYTIVIKGKGLCWFACENQTVINRLTKQSIDVSKCPSLQGLIADGFYLMNDEMKIDLTANPNLKYLQILNFFWPGIDEIKLAKECPLQAFALLSDQKQALEIDLSGHYSLTHLLISSPISGHSLKKLSEGSGPLRYLDLQSDETLIDLNNKMNLETLKIRGDNLTSLKICNNIKNLTLYTPLLSHSLTRFTNLESAELYGGLNTTLDFTSNKKLNRLACGDFGQLESLNLTGCDRLTSIFIGYNAKQRTLLINDCPNLNQVTINHHRLLVGIEGCNYAFTERDINTIFNQLPSKTGAKKSQFSLCFDRGDKSIAEKKGWEVTIDNGRFVP